MITKNISEIEDKLQNLVENIAIPGSKYEDAKNNYESVGNWLADEKSKLNKYNPQIYPQGSFALGTAVIPLEGCEHDVDAVCLLQADKEELTQEHLKELVGNRLKENAVYEKMLDPKNGGRRCWTLKYADSRNFHIDILPAIPCNTVSFNKSTYRNEVEKYAIYITDKEKSDYTKLSDNWLKSNPQGYINWFLNEMKNKTKTTRIQNFACNESVEELPLYKRKHVLQKAIQLLKRHRDIKFGSDEDKPISIIITTLATKAYAGEETLYDTLLNISRTMDKYIEKRNGVYWIENPVNSKENFADKWQETPRKAKLFFSWLHSLNKLFEDLLSENINFSEALDEAYGYITESNSNVVQKYTRSSYMSNPIVSFNLPYRQTPPWPMQKLNSVIINATFKKNNQVFNYESNGKSLPKHGSIHFTAKTDAAGPYIVKWQVLNTGEEARAAGEKQLRGDFYSSEPEQNNLRKENTLYRGRHMVQAYIIKNGVCIAKSEEFVVNIL